MWQMLWNLELSRAPKSFVSDYLAPKIKLAEEPWLWWSLQILTNPYNSSEGRGDRGCEIWNCQEPPKAVFSDYFLLSKHMFKYPDEHYRNGLSLPVHHTPPLVRVSVLAPKIKLAEEPWMVFDPYKSLQCLTTPQRGEVTEAVTSGTAKSHHNLCFLIIFY